MAAGAFDKWAATAAEPEQAPKSRYAPAPTTPEAADARLAEVQAAEQDIRAWAESKRMKKSGNVAGLPPTAAPSAEPDAASPKVGAFDKWASTIEQAPPPAPKPPGLMSRIGAALSEGRSQPEPSLSGITPEQARGITGEVDAPARPPDAQPTGLDAAVPRGRRQGGLRSEALPYVAGTEPAPTDEAQGQAGAGRGFVRERAGDRAGYMSGHMPFKNKAEAIDEAVNLLDEGADPQKVYDAFRTSGWQITRPEIESRGVSRGSPFFAPQKTRPADNAILAGQGGLDSIQAADISLPRDALNAVRRGGEQVKRTIDTGLWMAGATGDSDFAEQLRAGERRTGAMAPADATQAGLDRLQDANKTGEWGKVLSAVAQPQNWRALASMVLESAVGSAPVMVAGSLATALGGGVAGMPVTAAASFAQEYAAALGEEMEKRGVSASDPAAVVTLLQDSGFRRDIDNRGRIRGAAVGAFDSITMGFAGALGRTLHKAQAAGTLTRGQAVRGAAAGAGVEVGGGMGGEALAQAGVGDSKPLDVVVEGLAEAPSGVADVGAGFVKQRRSVGIQGSIERYMEPAQQDVPPSEIRAAAVRRFDELAAAFGLKPSAAKSAVQAANSVPAADAPGFLSRLVASFGKRGFFQKPIDEQSVEALQQAVDKSEAETGAPQDQSAPVDAGDGTGLAGDGLQKPKQAQSSRDDAVAADANAPSNFSKRTSFADELSGMLNVPGNTANPGDDNAAGTKGGIDGLVGDAKGDGNVSRADALLRHGYGSLDVPSQARVLKSVLSLVHDDEVFNAVVHSIPVAVMNQLVGSEAASERAFSDKSVLVHALATNRDLAVRGRAIDALVRSPAFAIAERRGPDLRWPLENGGAAVGAGENYGHESSLSPTNDSPLPTDAQISAGNYKKGHLRISGMDVSIENPKGSIRTSKPGDGKPWAVKMPAAYGYIRGSTGADGDHVDLFIGDKGDNGAFWVINQNHPDGKFDEHKVITGVDTAAEATDLYRRSFKDGYGDKLIGSVSQRMDAGQIKALLPDMAKAAAVHTPKATNDLLQPDVATPAAAPAAPADAGRDQPGGSGRVPGPGAAAPAGVDPGAATPDGRSQPDPVTAAPAPAADPALNAAAPVTTQPPAQAGATDAAAPRVIGKYGRTPKASVEVELRKNEDGTWTPFSERYAMVDFESGEPIVLPADVTDAQAADAIRAHGAITARDKFFGVKKDAAPADGTAAPAAEPAAAEHAPQPQPTREDLLLAAEKRVDGLKALLACLTS
jgi:hypothetical protein